MYNFANYVVKQNLLFCRTNMNSYFRHTFVSEHESIGKRWLSRHNFEKNGIKRTHVFNAIFFLGNNIYTHAAKKVKFFPQCYTIAVKMYKKAFTKHPNIFMNRLFVI